MAYGPLQSSDNRGNNTMSEYDVEQVTPYKGMRYKTRTMKVNAEDEARLMGLCGIDPAVFRGCSDPSAYISFAIREGDRNGISSNGGVNMVQGLVQSRPLRLDETITVTGEILDVQQSPRGRVTTSETWYHGENGELGITSKRTSLKTDPTQYADPKLRGAGERPAPVVADPSKLRSFGRFTLTPADVVAYGRDTTNPIHTHQDAAERAGYRAPIIGGGQGVRFLTAALWKEFAPQAIDMDIYFRRPLFWDDSFDIMVEEAGGKWTALCLAKDGKVATEMRVNSMTA
jgi:hydroxyacyl-ACP dehydratase HTD2-like protein with hotdog domain